MNAIREEPIEVPKYTIRFQTASTSAGEMVSARYKHNGTSLLLNNGLILLIGGANSAEVFDPQEWKFQQFFQVSWDSTPFRNDHLTTRR